MFDQNLVLRAAAAGALAADEDVAVVGVDFRGPDVHPITYVAIVPSAAAAALDTLVLTIQESDDNITFRNFLEFPVITTAGVYRVTGTSDARYRRYQANVTDVDGGGVTFGIVLIYPELGGQYDSF